jgi:hypothetical protein
MKRSMLGTIGAAGLCCVALVSQPQTPPTQQQSVDKQQCYDRSKTHTGIDPQAQVEQASWRRARSSCLPP